jgi:hypothetical protein
MARDCPVCKSQQLEAHAECYSTPTAESVSLNTLKEHWSGFFRDKVFFSYYRCRDCKALYCPKFFSNDELGQLYSVMPHNMADVPTTSLERTQKGYFDVLKKFSPLTGDYLEVGPDQGFLAQACAEGGKFENLWLFEPNVMVHQELERRVAGMPYRVFATMFDFSILPKNQISVLCMVHVLDHLLDPRTVLENMKPILEQKAILLFVTHDEASWLSRLLGSKWPPYCLQHPQLFSPKTITRLFESVGYKVLCVKKSYNYYPLGYLLKHLLWTSGIRADWFPNFFSLPLKLGNIITVVTPR